MEFESKISYKLALDCDLFVLGVVCEGAKIFGGLGIAKFADGVGPGIGALE